MHPLLDAWFGGNHFVELVARYTDLDNLGIDIFHPVRKVHSQTHVERSKVSESINHRMFINHVTIRDDGSAVSKRFILDAREQMNRE